ncbi:MAG: hypothetical protein LBE56_12855 [Tannerella sp.]|nr:hypothetical protein [Tannerella sp.]
MKNNPAYSGLSEERLLEEALATAIGDKGETMFRKGDIMKYNKFGDWLSRMWEWIAEQFRNLARAMTGKNSTGSPDFASDKISFDNLLLMVKNDLKDDRKLFNLSEKFYNDLAKEINGVKNIDQLNERLDKLSDEIYDKYVEKRAFISNSRTRGQIAALQGTNPREMAAQIGRLGIIYREDAADYTEEEVAKIKKPAEDILTNSRREIGEKWISVLKNRKPVEKYLVLRSLYQFIGKESEAYPIGYMKEAYDRTMEEFETSENPVNFNWYNMYNNNILEMLGDDPDAVIKVNPQNGVSGTWVKMNKASQSKNVEQTKMRVAAASNGTQWCTKYTDTSGTGAKRVIEEDDHDFYVFFPENSTQAQLAIVPIRPGEERQLTHNP